MSTQLEINNIVASSGNFTSALTINSTSVSVNGHTHSSSAITDFNSSVSGLLPTVSNSGDNRVLTSTGSSVGVNAEASLTFDGSVLSVPSGSTSLPSITVLGDSNTGLSFGTADTVSISTNGFLRLQVDSAGCVGLGTSGSVAARNLTLGKNLTGSVASYGLLQQGSVSSDVTTSAIGVYNVLNTAASAFTCASYTHFNAAANALGAGSAVTTQNGFLAGGTLTGATNNFGFRGAIAAATGRWNTYNDGTAQNYFAGNVGIGSGGSVPPELLSVMKDNNAGRTSILIDNLDQRLKMSCYYESGIGQYSEIQSTNNAETGHQVLILNRQGGNVGIGTSSPSTKLQIDGQTRVTDGTTNIDFVSSGAVGYVGTQTNHPLALRTNDTERVRVGTNGRTQFFAATEKYGVQLNNGSTGNGPFIGSDGADIFCISTAGGAERLRVNAAGELLIGTTTDNGAYLLQVNSQIYATNATIATSDSRFKTNVVSIDNATSIIQLLRPVSFDFIPQTDRNFSTDRQIGLIAQEVQEVLSNTDYKDSIVAQCGDHLGLAYEKLVPLLIKALQETNQELQNIKNRLSALEGE